MGKAAERKQREPEGGEDLAGNAEQPPTVRAAVEERARRIEGKRNGSRDDGHRLGVVGIRAYLLQEP